MEIPEEWVMGLASKTVGEPDLTGRSRRPGRWHLRKRRRTEDPAAEQAEKQDNQSDE